jgi:hypothetical protein
MNFGQTVSPGMRRLFATCRHESDLLHGFDASMLAEHGGTTALRLSQAGVRRLVLFRRVRRSRLSSALVARPRR